MKRIGLIYSPDTKKTAFIADKIKAKFGNLIDVISVEDAWKEEFEKYNYFIVGTSTWFDGELPSYWDELLPELKTLDLSKKKVALFGLGDQVKYPENFADAVGILADVFVGCGAILAGQTSADLYTFENSKAFKNGVFQGLILDMENQADQTDTRINRWAEQLKKEFVG